MTCRLCERDVPLIQAHIIPRPFYRMSDATPSTAKVLSNRPGDHPKRVRTGFYDTGILCGPCDERIGIWDQYGAQVFVRELPTLAPQPNAERPVAFMRRTFDFARLRLFLLSVLWRAGVSSLDMFRRVRLGPYAAQLHRMILDGDPGDADNFSTVLSAFTVDGRLPSTGVPLSDPFRERWQGVNAYRLSFGTVTAYVKVDQSPFPPSFARIAMREGQPLC